jgi:homocysteine S-methyltransferase
LAETNINPFLGRLKQGFLLADGAMGTELYRRGIPYDRCFEELNLSKPELVQAIHLDYIRAGAELIETNTFGGNAFRLAAHGFQDKVRIINLQGAKIAREAREIMGIPVFVAGAVGPVGKPLEPYGVIAAKEARAAFKEQIEALLEGGVDLIILETFSDLNEIREALLVAKEVCDLPVIAQMTFAQDLRTPYGETPQEVLQVLKELGADVVGANCSVGSQKVLQVMEIMLAHNRNGVFLSAMPNAGFPTLVGGRVFYHSGPEYMAEYARIMVEKGVSIVGGCCGTTPDHTAAMARELRRVRPQKDGLSHVEVKAPQEEGHRIRLAAPGYSPLHYKLGKEFVVSVEVDPPKGLNPTKILEGARLLKERGVDAINVADSPMARVRMSAMAAALLIHERVGIDVILHYTTRDRNLMALQSDLLGAHALGLRNILALTGDPPSLGDYPSATAVYDVNSIGLIRIIKRFNEGYDLAGKFLGDRAYFTVGCALDPTRADLEAEIRTLRKKLEAGADFVMTQPIYEIDTLRRVLDRLGEIQVPILVGILPLQSHRHAEFLHNEVPGITVPDWARERMRRAGNRGIEEGIKMAQEILARARELVQGAYIMPSFGRYEVAAEVLSAIGR